MNKTILFAIDVKTQEVIVSESPKGSHKIEFIERVSFQDNEVLYHAVSTLTYLSKAPEVDKTLFKAMDEICQLIYNQHIK